ncbi:hypothetical protein L1049_013688 [Liquidambar formosana]|uniref:Uncharacterized protein n=1 Tax=Liquidambar formosana TaxID=63359 RepID=A0AAP0RL57_LIQFO
MALDSILNSRADEQRWVEQMSDILKKEVNNDLINIPAYIFQVPKTVSAVKPEAYAPQLIALGPYHHFRPDLYVMERHKLAAVKRAQTQFQDNLKFERIVDKLMELELNIRACYHKYLDLDGVTLAWMMAIDVSFLLDFLATFVDNKGIHTLSSSSSTSTDPSPFIFDSAGRRLAQDAILRDVMMLENQIPIFLLREMLAIRCSFSSDKVDEVFPAILVGFCKAISPLKLEDYPLHKVTKHVHLLDLLYFMILPRNEPGNSDAQSRIRIDERPGEVFLNLWGVASTQIGIINKIKEPVESIVGVISKLPGISNLVTKLSYGETTQNNGLKRKQRSSSGGHHGSFSVKPLQCWSQILPHYCCRQHQDH